MFKAEKNRISKTSQDLSIYIESFDVYNAEIMGMIRDSFYERVPYEIRTFEYRPDLIAQDIYGDSKYMGIFMLTCGVGLEGLYKGATISILPKSVIDEIIYKLQR